MDLELDRLDRHLLNLAQGGFPLVAEPFAALGAELGISGAEVLARLRRLKGGGLIRQLCAIFDTKALGYQSTLVAMRLAPERLDEAAVLISAHPGVSHNYARSHAYNLWFTLALPSEENLEAAVSELGHRVGAEATLLLPMLRPFKIGVLFDMEGGRATSPSPSRKGAATAAVLSTEEVALVRELQEDLPLKEHPFEPMADRLGLSEDELLQAARDLQQRGIMRRYGALLAHRKAGFTANAMGCWVVPEERIEAVGTALASFPEVTHCYQRPTYPDWPYSLLTMIHGRSREECQRLAQAMAEHTSIGEYTLLYSTRQYKKARPRYFV